MIIAIPSKSRAGKTTSQKILPNATFFVPESQVHQYSNIKNIVGVPKNIQGITKTRNWILKKCGEKRVVFIDDDVKACGYVKLDERRSHHVKMKGEEFWINEFHKLFDVTEQLNYKIWGIRTESSKRGTYPYKPISLKTYATASCMGIVNDGEYYFDETFITKEDYELCLRHIVEKGGILGVRYVYWENSHWEDEGGCSDYRTIAIEREMIKKLVKMYPGMVRSAKRKANKFTIQLTL